MMKIIFIIIFIVISLFAEVLPYSLTTNNTQNNRYIKILDVKKLVFNDIHELSGLAYKNNNLYALSDRGLVYRFGCDIKQNKIQTLVFKEKYILRNKKLKRFKKKKRDSEGLCFYKDGFLISFERKNRVLLFSSDGIKIQNMKLNSLLANQKKYQGSNKGLESVAYSEQYGLITIPELPLKGSDLNYHTLYSRDKIWKFQAKGAAAVTDIAFRDRDRLLVLLREYSYLTQQRKTSLIEVKLDECNKKRICKSRLIADLDSHYGWEIDNFEGLAKVGKNRFLMISDDNNNFFQKTLLVLFEIMN